jgi:hypothetical protein
VTQRRRTPLARLAVILGGMLAVAGCTRTEDYLEVARAQQKAMQDVTVVLAKINDEKDMAAARETLDDRFAEYEAIARKARDLPKPAPPEVGEKMKAEGFVRSFERMQQEIGRVKGLPGGKDFFQQFQGHTTLLQGAD